MKSQQKLAVLVTAMVLSLTIVAPKAEAGGSFGLHFGSNGFGVSVGYGDWGPYTNAWSNPQWNLSFNATLSGYGDWVWVNGLGRVWRPWVTVDWRPYTYGRWVYTSFGWTWVAYEPWGYIPHHYGHWAHSSYGWVWAPGYTYCAANVVWVGAGNHIGWYAAPPRGWSHYSRGFHHGYNHGFRDGEWHGYHRGYWDGYHDAQYATYVQWQHLGSENVSGHAVNHSRIPGGRVQNLDAPPTAREVRDRGGVEIARARISSRTVRAGDREITVARPEGVGRSIERHAGATVIHALSDTARERRQPQSRAPSAAGSPSGRASSERIEKPSSRQPTASGRVASSRTQGEGSSFSTPSGRSRSGQQIDAGTVQIDRQEVTFRKPAAVEETSQRNTGFSSSRAEGSSHTGSRISHPPATSRRVPTSYETSARTPASTRNRRPDAGARSDAELSGGNQREHVTRAPDVNRGVASSVPPATIDRGRSSQERSPSVARSRAGARQTTETARRSASDGKTPSSSRALKPATKEKEETQRNARQRSTKPAKRRP